MPRIKRVDSKKEQERAVDEFYTRGYKIKHQGQHSAKVKEKDWGGLHTHIFVFVLTFVVAAVTFDIGGLPAGGVWGVIVLVHIAYGAYSWYTAEEVIIRIEGENIK